MTFNVKDNLSQANVPFATDAVSGEQVARVNIHSAALPTGASTSANQTTANGSLASAVTALQAIDGDLGAPADAVASTDTGTFSLIALFKRLLAKFTTQFPAALGTNGGLKVEGISAAAVPINTKPVYLSGGITSATTSGTGATYVVFASQACASLDIVNYTGTDIEYRRGGAGSTMRIPSNSAREIVGITNANEIGVRRVDQSNTQVIVAAEWLS